MTRAAVMLAVALTAAAARGDAPHAAASPDGTVRVTLPSSVLAKVEIRRQLANGLTTVFLVRITGGSKPLAARVEIRYELWDEVYLTDVVDHTGHHPASLPNYEALTQWWSRARLAVLSPLPVPKDFDIWLDVLPFSAREEAEAQRWLSRSVSEARSAKGLAKEVPQPEGSPGNDFFDVLIGTTVKRKPILQFRWNVRVEGEVR